MASSFLGFVVATQMDVTQILSGSITAGDTVTGAGVTPGTFVITQLSGAAGQEGAYTVSVSQTVQPETLGTGVLALMGQIVC